MAISRLTGQDKSGSTTAASFTVSYPSTPTPGNLLIAIVYNSNTGTGTTVTGFTQDATINDSLAHSISIFSRVCQAGDAVGVVANDAGGGASMHMLIFEYSGLATTSVTDQIKTASSNSTSVNSLASGSTPTTTVADELWIGGAGVAGSGSSPTWTNSFTAHLNTTRAFMSDRIVAATGTASTTFGYTGTAAKVNIAVVTYKTSASTAYPSSLLPLMGMGS